MFKSLEYTEIAEKRLERYEDGKCGERGTKNNLQHIFSLYEKKILNLDQLLWLQAYEGFSFLSETTFGRAKELCRLVFRDVLHGEETKDGLTYDGKIYSSLTDDDLIKKMVEKLRSCYKKSGMHDVYPGDGKLIKYLLGGSKFERETLVKLLIASGIGYDRIQDFLGRLAFMKKLSVAVPNELVWIYCLKKGLKWEKATELSEIAEELYNEAIQERAEVEADDRIPYTDENIGGLLDGVPEERFIEEFLVICCKRAAKKSREIKNNEKQYSQTAWIIVKELSVFDVQHYGAELQNEIEKLQNKDLKRDFQRKFKELKEKIQKELEKELSEDSRENFRRKFEKLEEKIQEKLEEELQQGIGTLQRYSERCQKRLKEELPEDSKERVQKELGECQKILEELEEKKIREKLKRKLQKKLSPYSDPKCYSSKKRYLFRSDMLRCYKKCKLFSSASDKDGNPLSSLDEYNFPNVRGEELSVDMYHRFLNYRIMGRSSIGNRRSNMFCKEYGKIDKEIIDNILSYQSFWDLNKFRHNISRYVILIASFYFNLVRHWADKLIARLNCRTLKTDEDIDKEVWKKYLEMEEEDDLWVFVEKDWKEIKALFQTYLQNTNSLLEESGYAQISAKNPFDAFIRIAMYSPCPLEIYTRILELNVISSYFNDPEIKEENYPSKEHIKDVLTRLKETYELLEKQENLGLELRGRSEDLQDDLKKLA